MKKIKLKEIIEVTRGMSLQGKYYSNTGKYIRLTLGNFNYPNMGFKYNTSKEDIFFTGEVKPEYILKKDDIITPLTEQVKGLLGETAFIPVDNIFIQSGDIALVSPIKDKSDKNFIYYLISSDIIKKQLSISSQQTKIRHTSPKYILNCQAFIPDIYTQEKIGNLLRKLDELIKKNNSIYSELEKMAKTLYDYWFVQFDFPDENGRPYKSSGGKMVWSEELQREIPYGWEVHSLTKYCYFYNGYAFSSSTYCDNGKYKVYTIKNITNYGIDATNCSFINIIPQRMNNECILKPGDILLTLTGHVGRVGIVFETNTLLNQRVLKLVSNHQILLYLILIDKNINRQIVNKANGSSQKNLSPNILHDILYPYPSQNIINKFTKQYANIYNKLILIKQKNQELTSLRDFLLPLLMNGQAVIKD